MPHVPGYFDILHFQIRNGCLKVWIPIDQTFATINEALVIHLNKNFNHSIMKVRAVFMAYAGIPLRTGHGEGGPFPITRGAKPLELVHNRAARVFFPFPNFF